MSVRVHGDVLLYGVAAGYRRNDNGNAHNEPGRLVKPDTVLASQTCLFVSKVFVIVLRLRNQFVAPRYMFYPLGCDEDCTVLA